MRYRCDCVCHSEREYNHDCEYCYHKELRQKFKWEIEIEERIKRNTPLLQRDEYKNIPESELEEPVLDFEV